MKINLVKERSIARYLVMGGHRLLGRQKMKRRFGEDDCAEDVHYDEKNLRRAQSVELKDYLNPLYRWLCSKIGQKWDECYSELVSQEKRQVHLRHLREHLKGYIDFSAKKIGHQYGSVGRGGFYPRSWGFFVDEDGLLQEWQKQKKVKPFKDNWTYDVDDFTIYKLADGRLFRAESGRDLNLLLNAKKLVRSERDEPWRFAYGLKPFAHEVIGPFVAYYGEIEKNQL